MRRVLPACWVPAGTEFAGRAVRQSYAVQTRGWDLAKATDQQMPTDDMDVDQVLDGMKRSLEPEARQPGFGPEVQPRPIDRLAAFLGRTP